MQTCPMQTIAPRTPCDSTVSIPSQRRGLTWSGYTWLLLGLLAFEASVANAQSLTTKPMDYHDQREMKLALEQLSSSPHAQLKTIGVSIDFTGTEPVEYPILALRVSANQPLTGRQRNNRDEGDLRPSILFDAGIHPREWVTSESLLELAKHLVAHAGDAKSRVGRAVKDVDVWIIPMGTPAGRVIDDRDGGDPKQFFTSDARQTKPGWRGNGDTRIGTHGIDLGRNFSHDWTNANADPQGNHWRGLAPFSTTEASALRQFVQNHSITMAVHLHSNSQDIAVVRTLNDTSGIVMRRRCAEIWLEGCRILADRLGKPVEELNLQLDEKRYSTSVGQFFAWLVDPSDTPSQPDEGTTRSIKTFMLEMPFDNPNHGNYTGGPFQHKANDGSNSFHPSHEATRLLIQEAFIPMSLYLIEQASIPDVATERNSLVAIAEPRGFVPGDFGIVSGKIASGPGKAGAIRSEPAKIDHATRQVTAPARDVIDPGRHMLVFRVQNSGGAAETRAAMVIVERRPQQSRAEWKHAQASKRLTFRLRPGISDQRAISMTFVGGQEYRVSIILEDDGLADNNRKVFRFECDRAN